MPVFSAEKSKIKMVILTGPKDQNATWYSPIKENTKPSNRIVDDMLKRLKQNELYAKAQVCQFYENGQLIYEFKK